MTPAELKDVLQNHARWLNNNDKGARANLSGANLRRANLSRANLRRADLRGADLENIHYDEHTAFYALQCPEDGAFIGWKQCRNGVIVKLQIPAKARRSSATSRKCRAEYVKVLDVLSGDEGISQHDSSVVYRKGKTIKPDSWDNDRWNECSHGIHFFLTRQEAEQYSL
jgi:hypothetical protein